jgi:uncharacterized protein
MRYFVSGLLLLTLAGTARAASFDCARGIARRKDDLPRPSAQ